MKNRSYRSISLPNVKSTLGIKDNRFFFLNLIINSRIVFTVSTLCLVLS